MICYALRCYGSARPPGHIHLFNHGHMTRRTQEEPVGSGKTSLQTRFLGLKSHSGHKKLTSQKACLEVHTTVSKDSRAKKRFAVLRMTKNTTFGVKHYKKLRFCVTHSTENRFLALKSLETVVSISKYDF